MNSIVNLTHSPRTEIPYINEEEAKSINEKGWSLSYTYYFSEIRDVYLALNIKEYENIEEFTKFCLSIKLPFVKTEWNKRRIQEHLNALINFSLVDANYRIIKRVFNNRQIGNTISEDDLEVFREIYFNYFRFKEVFSWFIDLNPINRLALVNSIDKEDINNKSKPLFAFSEKGKFTDTFFYELKNDISLYYIKYKGKSITGSESNGNEDLMRFWDVFVAWGTRLKILEKFNLENLGIKTSSGKNIICCYVISDYLSDFNLLDYIHENFKSSYIYLPELVFQIATNFRLSLEKTHEIIINQYKMQKEHFSLERTSEIFIRRGEIKSQDKILFPKYNDSYISHLVIRK